jgi:hypothetical protein
MISARNKAACSGWSRGVRAPGMRRPWAPAGWRAPGRHCGLTRSSARTQPTAGTATSRSTAWWPSSGQDAPRVGLLTDRPRHRWRPPRGYLPGPRGRRPRRKPDAGTAPRPCDRPTGVAPASCSPAGSADLHHRRHRAAPTHRSRRQAFTTRVHSPLSASGPRTCRSRSPWPCNPSAPLTGRLACRNGGTDQDEPLHRRWSLHPELDVGATSPALRTRPASSDFLADGLSGCRHHAARSSPPLFP